MPAGKNHDMATTSRVRRRRPLARFWVVALIVCASALWWGWTRLAPSLTARGTAAYNRRDWSEASRLARQRIETANDDRPALRLLARAEARLGNFGVAQSLYARLDEHNLEAEDYCVLGLGRALSGEPLEAQKVLRLALSADPDHAESLHLLALAAFQRSQWVEATRAAERLARRQDWAARANLLLGMIRAADHDPAEAARCSGWPWSRIPRSDWSNQTRSARRGSWHARCCRTVGRRKPMRF